MRVQNIQTYANILRPIGYGLLLLVTIDAIATLIPPRFFSATWEFNTIGTLVNRIPLILLGFGAVFSGDREFKTPRDKLIWRITRWLTLLVAILFLIMAPLLLVNSFRIKNQTDVRITQEVTQRLTELDKLREQLQQRNPIDLRNNLLQLLRNNALPDNPKIDINAMSPEDLRKQLLVEINSEKQIVRKKVENRWKSNRLELIKNTIKWFLGCIVGSVMLFFIWQFAV